LVPDLPANYSAASLIVEGIVLIDTEQWVIEERPKETMEAPVKSLQGFLVNLADSTISGCNIGCTSEC